MSDSPLSSFTDLGVPARLDAVLAAQGITSPTPIQAATLPDSLDGRDLLGRGRTGSGKTYAFLLPVVARLSSSGTRRTPKRPRALILAPTRELVAQIDASLSPLAQAAGLRTRTVFGGVGQNPQVQALRAGVDIVVATPGRLEDLIGQGACDLGGVEVTVLDEADHMADLGFLPAVRRLLDATPGGSQRLLFSATLDRAVNVLVKRYLVDPVTHEADSATSPVAAMEHHVLHLHHDQRVPVLVDLASAPGRTVVFTRTKRGAKTLARQLNTHGVPAVELHGNLGQNARTRNMDAFHSGRASTLVATDIAARGIHVDDVALVVHADPPAEHKAYLHRSGRTARAGAAGTVVTLMTDQQRADVRALTRAAGITPTTTKVPGPGHEILRVLAPGERVLVAGGLPAGTDTDSGSRRQDRHRLGERRVAVAGTAAAPRGRGRGRPQPAGRAGAAAPAPGPRRRRRAPAGRGDAAPRAAPASRASSPSAASRASPRTAPPTARRGSARDADPPVRGPLPSGAGTPAFPAAGHDGDVDEARTRLRRQRADAVAQLAQLTGDHDAMVAASRDTNADDEHDPEGATIAFERSQLDALVRQVRSDLTEIDAALDRLAAGGYGVCERCGDPIPDARLDARPAARTCVACAGRR